MKVGKEGVLGTIAALEAWGRRDHAAEAAREASILAEWEARLAEVPGLQLARHADWTGNPITRLELTLDPGAAGLEAWELADRLGGRDPAIHVRDDLAEHQRLYLDPCNVTAEEARLVGAAIADEVARALACRRRPADRARRAPPAGGRGGTALAGRPVTAVFDRDRNPRLQRHRSIGHPVRGPAKKEDARWRARRFSS